MSETKHRLKWTLGNKKIKVLVPYVETEGMGFDWGKDGISITIDVQSLLQLVLPAECINDGGCCAVKFAAGDTEPQVRPATKELVTDQYKWEEDGALSYVGSGWIE